MQTLTIDFICSLDGYGAAEGWPGLWGMGGPEYFAWLDAAHDKDAPLLMGATTYRLMSALTAGGEEGTDVLNGIEKHVFSSTLEEPLTWQNSRLVRADAVEYVRRLKEQSRRPLRTLGSIALCRSLLLAGLVDRYRVVLFPVITGATGQDRIFDGYPDVRLDLVESRTFDGRLQLLEYVPTVLDGPPGR
ncbi:dihydrofolate reductase family protein [Microbacterium sp. 22242]|uniref:dihydrofolate reductase family protein n=1 Tax=Microbacterium sp. 22242 TaxID=3453896 RepID=UPI003F83DF0F